jgi:hypothetical protein
MEQDKEKTSNCCETFAGESFLKDATVVDIGICILHFVFINPTAAAASVFLDSYCDGIEGFYDVIGNRKHAVAAPFK